MPIGALGQAGQSAFRLIRRLHDELKVNTSCGASNISFGLPNRHGLNQAFLAMAIGAGMTSAIMNPLHLEEMTGVMGADTLMGHDAHCARLDPQVPRGAAGRRADGGCPRPACRRRSSRRRRCAGPDRWRAGSLSRVWS